MHQKRAILHTFQANGGARAPLATLLYTNFTKIQSGGEKGQCYISYGYGERHSETFITSKQMCGTGKNVHFRTT